MGALGDRATTAMVTEGWTAKDALAHMIHWAGQIAFGKGAPIEMPAWTSGVEGRPSGEDAIPWGGDRPLWKQIAAETYEHWPAHSADIERAAKVTA